MPSEVSQLLLACSPRAKADLHPFCAERRAFEDACLNQLFRRIQDAQRRVVDGTGARASNEEEMHRLLTISFAVRERARRWAEYERQCMECLQALSERARARLADTEGNQQWE